MGVCGSPASHSDPYLLTVYRKSRGSYVASVAVGLTRPRPTPSRLSSKRAVARFLGFHPRSPDRYGSCSRFATTPSSPRSQKGKRPRGIVSVREHRFGRPQSHGSEPILRHGAESTALPHM